MLGKFASNKQAKLRKGKDKQKKKRRNPTKSRLLKRGWWTKRKYKNGFLKRKTKAKTQNRKKRNTLRQAFGGNKIDKKPLKLQENSLFGPFYKTQDKNTGNKKQNHQKAKKKAYQKKTFLHFGKQPLFLVNFCFCSSCILSCLQSCVLLKHSKNSVFSGTHLLCITDSKTPFRVQTQNGTFATKRAILGFPLCLLKPLFL